VGGRDRRGRSRIEQGKKIKRAREKTTFGLGTNRRRDFQERRDHLPTKKSPRGKDNHLNLEDNEKLAEESDATTGETTGPLPVLGKKKKPAVRNLPGRVTRRAAA